jgi:hypothetical protein
VPLVRVVEVAVDVAAGAFARARRADQACIPGLAAVAPQDPATAAKASAVPGSTLLDKLSTSSAGGLKISFLPKDKKPLDS